MPKKYFVTRHKGAVTWAANGGAKARKVSMENFDVAQVNAGDIVMGTLPVHLAAQVNASGGHYWHLAMDIPPEWRGKELSAEQMRAFGARLEEFRVQSQGVRVSDDPEVRDATSSDPATHMCIATAQTLANLLPMLALPWKRAVIFASPDMADKALHLKAVLEVLKPRQPDGEATQCEIVAMPAKLDWVSLQSFATQQVASFGREGRVDFNVSGGTKPMSMALSDAFRSQGRLLYCSTQSGEIEVMDSLKQAPIGLPANLLNLDSYLTAQGYRAVRKLSPHDATLADLQRRQRLTASLVLHSKALNQVTWKNASSPQYKKNQKPASEVWFVPSGTTWDDSNVKAESLFGSTLQGLLHELGNGARELRDRTGHIKRPFRPCVWISCVPNNKTWNGVFAALQEAGLIKDLVFRPESDGTADLSFEMASAEAAVYLAGGYLEEYALLCLSSLDIPPDHFAGSVGIGHLHKQKNVSEEMNELDAAVVWRNQMLVLECKAGIQLTGAESQAIISKLDQLKKNLGGSLGRAWCVTHRELDPGREADATVLQRAKDNNIKLLHGATEMRNLGKTLSKELGAPVATPWPALSLVLEAFKPQVKTR